MAATLSVSDWKKQIKPYPTAADIGPVTKALEEYAKVGGKGDPDLALDALDAVIVRAKAARKKNAKDKAVVEVLDDLIGDAEDELDTVARDAARNAPDDDDEDDAAAGDALRAMLIRVKKVDQDKALPFVVALGTVPGMVIAKRPPLSRDHKNTARAMREGKGKLLMGQCFGEDGKFIFEFPDAPPGGLTKVIKKAAKLHANMEIRLKVRGGGAEIDDEADLGELTDFGTEADEVAPAAAPAELFKARAREVRAALDALKADNPGLAAPLMTEFATALGHAQAGRYDQARGLLDIIARRAGDATKGAGAPTQGGAAEKFQGRVNALTPVLKEALQRGGEAAQALKLKFSEAGVFSRKGDFGKAGALLDEVESLLAQATPPAAPPPPPLDQGPKFTLQAKAVKARLDSLAAADPARATTLRTDYATALGHAQARRFEQAAQVLDEVSDGIDAAGKEAAAAIDARLKALLQRAAKAGLDPAGVQEVKLLVSQAQVHSRKGEFAQAGEMLGRAEAFVASTTKTAPKDQAGEDEAPEAGAGEAGGKGTVSLVKLGKARIEWLDVRRKAMADMESLKDAIASDYDDQPDAASAVASALAKLDASLAQINETLGDQLDAVLNADPAARGRLADKARTTMQKFMDLLDDDPILSEIDGNDYLPGVDITAPLFAKLEDINVALG